MVLLSEEHSVCPFTLSLSFRYALRLLPLTLPPRSSLKGCSSSPEDECSAPPSNGERTRDFNEVEVLQTLVIWGTRHGNRNPEKLVKTSNGTWGQEGDLELTSVRNQLFLGSSLMLITGRKASSVRSRKGNKSFYR